jgi:acyl-CoA synthetase (AMP-forming)/AMP-acid ligase II
MSSILQGLMQDRPLLVSTLIEHAAHWHRDVEIVSRAPEGTLHRYTYADACRRSRQVANALTAIGVRRGDRIATLAWNTPRHLELYFGVSGIGAVLHTVNPRLDRTHIEFILRDAEDRYVFFDLSFLETIESLAPQLPGVRGFIAMAAREQLPVTRIANVLCYEDLLAEYADDFDWPVFDETSASSLCYTSGTTGSPKGVLYSHRSTLLHAFAACAVDGFGISSGEAALVAVPMFHANAWGMPYAAPMSGAKLVLPGTKLDGASLYELMRATGVTMALGVPTVWIGLIDHIERHGLDPAKELQLRRVVIGGAAPPRSMVETFQERFAVQVIHAWGMTETSPIGTVCNPLPKHDRCTPAERLALQAKQGRPVFGVELKVADTEGRPVPHNGITPGHLKVRGPWIASSYFKGRRGDAVDAEGFFDSGDIATIDADGFMQITDRAKDLIKSGGEWISSVALEDAACSHPAVAEAAVIAMAHPKWLERPLLIIVPRAGQLPSPEEILRYLAQRVPKWWVPDDVICIESMPHGATGKLQKSVLRERFRAHRPPGRTAE